MKTRLIAVLAAVAVNTLFGQSDNADSGVLAWVWVFNPKNGSEVEFRKSFSEHVEWRREHSDPWTWIVFRQENGPDIGSIHAISFGHHWSDFDAYKSGFEARASEHWTARVAMHVESYESMIIEYMPEQSSWPADASHFNVFRVWRHHLKPGKDWQALQLIKSVKKAVVDAELPKQWSVYAMHSGGRAPTVFMVDPAENWAGMENPAGDVYEAVRDFHGQEKASEIFSQFHDSIAQSEATMLRRVPEWHVEGAN